MNISKWNGSAKVSWDLIYTLKTKCVSCLLVNNPWNIHKSYSRIPFKQHNLCAIHFESETSWIVVLFSFRSSGTIQYLFIFTGNQKSEWTISKWLLSLIASNNSVVLCSHNRTTLLWKCNRQKEWKADVLRAFIIAVNK